MDLGAFTSLPYKTNEHTPKTNEHTPFGRSYSTNTVDKVAFERRCGPTILERSR